MKPLITGKDVSLVISGKEIVLRDIPEDKLQLLEKAQKDPVCIDLLLSNKFEAQKYEQTLINWGLEFHKIRVSKVADCFELSTPSLSTMKKYKGEFKTLALICKMLEEVYSFFNVTNTLSEIQLQMSAALILEEFYFLTIADIRLCFFNAYKNKYGKLYNRLDGSIIMDWLSKYTEERALEAQRISEKRSAEDKSESFTPEAAGMFKKIFESVKDKKPAKTDKVYYSSYSQFRETLTQEDRDKIALSINYAFGFLCGMDYDLDSFTTWKKNSILYRINKGGNLGEILEALKEGKI